MNEKLYWTDNCDDDIEVYDPSTQVRRVLFDVDLLNPYAIVVDPTTGYVYTYECMHTLMHAYIPYIICSIKSLGLYSYS